MSQTRIEQTIGYTFQNKKLLTRSLTHASKSTEHLERQEFLGDAVLGLAIAEFLYHQHPKSAEGDLSKMRANLVCKSALLDIAKQWKLADVLLVGEGERGKSGILKSESIAANAVESIIGAVFEDGGWPEAKALILRAWADSLKDVKPVNLRDAKSQLQELTQSFALGLPCYELVDLGINHSPRFQATCLLQGKKLGQGRGQRKKEAEINAAAQSLKSNVLQALTTD